MSDAAIDSGEAAVQLAATLLPERQAAERLACARFMELLAETQSPVQLAALIRVIDKLPWPAAEADKAPNAGGIAAFPELDGLDLPGLLDEARRLIAVIEEHSAIAERLDIEALAPATEDGPPAARAEDDEPGAGSSR